VAAVLRRVPLHDGAMQTVSAAYLAQPPSPSQAPVWPQVDLSVAAQTLWGSAIPMAVGQQVPRRPLWLQLTQGPPQGTLQQNPSAQKFDAHWLAVVQTAPIGFFPQLPFTHLTLDAQSASDEQVKTQALVLLSQLKGAQIVEGPGVQAPLPSQTRMPPTEAPSQVPARQTVPETKLRQPPLPSQVPSRPQVAASLFGQVAGERGESPAATNEQVPGADTVLQDLQVSVQALLQQTPSAQKPLAQFPLQLHGVPFGCRRASSPAQLPPPSAAPPSCFLGPPPFEWQEAAARASSATKSVMTRCGRYAKGQGTSETIHRGARPPEVHGRRPRC